MKNLIFGALFLLLSHAPLKAEENRIGVFTGTFDPVHLMHLHKAEIVKETHKLSKVYLFPNFAPDHKENASDFDTRYELLRLAIQDSPHFVLPPKEVFKKAHESKDPHHMLFDWAKKNEKKSTHVFQLMGSDSYARFLENPKAKEIIKSSGRGFIVMEREGFTDPGFKKLPQVKRISIPEIEVSSSKIKTNPLLYEALLPKPVAQAVKKEGMFGRGPERGIYDLPEKLSTQIYREQRLNNRVADLRVFVSDEQIGLKQEMRPESRPIFKLFHVDVPLEKLEIIKTGKSPDRIITDAEGNKFYRFFVHPESKSFFEEALKGLEWKQEYLATPTASHRSLIVWDPHSNEDPMGLKVSLNAEIGGSVRLVTRKQIERAAATSALINQVSRKELEEQGIIIIDEPVGVYLKDHPFGFSERTIPLHLPQDIEVVPMFSLYTKPATGPALIEESLKKSGLSAKEFARKYFISPLIKQGMYLAFEQGLIPEAHSQNMLIEMKNGIPTGRFWYRDLAGFAISPEFRSIRGDDLSFLPKSIPLDSLKMERAELVDRMDKYLKSANFYAMREALSANHPEITPQWLGQVFVQEMATQMGKYTGIDAKNFKDLLKAEEEYLKRAPLKKLIRTRPGCSSLTDLAS